MRRSKFIAVLSISTMLIILCCSTVASAITKEGQVQFEKDLSDLCQKYERAFKQHTEDYNSKGIGLTGTGVGQAHAFFAYYPICEAFTPPRSWWLENDEKNPKPKNNLHASIMYAYYLSEGRDVVISFTGDGIIVNEAKVITNDSGFLGTGIGGNYTIIPNRDKYIVPSLKWDTIANKCKNDGEYPTSIRFYTDNDVGSWFGNLVPNLFSYAMDTDRGGYIMFQYVAKNGKSYLNNDSVTQTSINCGECGRLTAEFANNAMLLARRHFTKK